jgi:hypothetical protein
MSEYIQPIEMVQFCISEKQLARDLGLGQPELAKRRIAKLIKGEHWDYKGMPKQTFYHSSGVDAMKLMLNIDITPKEPVVEPIEPKVIRVKEIPKIKANTMIATHGRPGWWTNQEAIVFANKFANKRMILVEYEGKRVPCKVKASHNFISGMVIPVRQYDNILVAARHPRFAGIW